MKIQKEPTLTADAEVVKIMLKEEREKTLEEVAKAMNKWVKQHFCYSYGNVSPRVIMSRVAKELKCDPEEIWNGRLEDLKQKLGIK